MKLVQVKSSGGLVMRGLMLVLAVFAGPVAGQDRLDVIDVVYACERSVDVPVTYINGDGYESMAVINVEGRQVPMVQGTSASGAKYIGLDEQISYRWWTKGDEGMLLFLEADHTAEEEILLRYCTLKQPEF